MFAGLRDAYIHGGNKKALNLLVAYGNWCEKLTSGLTDAQMQQMLSNEHGGMNETLADIYALTGNKKYLELANPISADIANTRKTIRLLMASPSGTT